MRRTSLAVLLLSLIVLLYTAPSARADLDCDGVNDLLTTAVPLDTFVNPNSFTVMAWVKSTGSTFADDMCWNAGALWTDANEYVAFGRSGTAGTGLACVQVFGGSGTRVTSALSAGWHHLAATLSAGTLTLYVDGVSVGSLPTLDIDDLTGGLRLCGGADPHSPDRLTEVQVYDVAVPVVEIARHATSRLRRVDRTPPTGAWPLQDCAHGASGNGVTFRDRSGAGRHLSGEDGGNGGLTCRGSEWVARPWGIQ